MAIAAAGMLLAGPLIDWLTGINSGMHLPEAMKGIENWMIEMEENGKEATVALTGGTSIPALFANLFVVAFTAAVSEELFFRGVVQQVSLECFRNKHIAIWLGAVLFSAGHLQFFGFFPRLFMGAYLGYLFYYSGSLWPGILAHFVNNGLIVLLTWLSHRGTISMDLENASFTEKNTTYVVISAIVVVISLLLVKRIEKKAKERSADILQ
jgi:membrane protease YdiL (CAAX protease family)